MTNSQWNKIRLGDFVTLQRGHDLPASVRKPGNVPVMGSAGLTGYHNKALMKGPGVTIGRSGVGSMGVVNYCQEDYWPHNTVLYITDFKGNYPIFAYYFLKSMDLRSFDSGSAQASLNRNYLYPTIISIPSVDEQKNIADFLFDLDKKIELNRRMNRTLDVIGWSLFKNVFIYRQQIVQWDYARIGDKLTTYLGGTPSRDKLEYWDDGTIPWINSGKVNEFRIIDAVEFITKSGLDNSSTKVVPPRSTVIAITGATLGQVSLLEIEACTNQSVVSVLGSDELPSEFVYFWIKHNIDDLVAWQTGGAQQHINKNNVNDFKILCPDASTMQDFIVQVRPIFDLIRSNCFESRTLASLRDSLLPKLMRAEVKVKDVEEYDSSNNSK